MIAKKASQKAIQQTNKKDSSVSTHLLPRPTLRDRALIWLKTYQRNKTEAIAQLLVLVLAIFGVVLIGRYAWQQVQQLGNSETALEVEASPLPVLDALPTEILIRENEQGEVVPVGLPVTYRVQPGDSTWKIAEAFYGTGQNYVDIEVANGLTPNQFLEVGQELLIPSVPVRGLEPLQVDSQTTQEYSVNDGASSSSTHTVETGDTLWHIAEEQYQDPYQWTAIYNSNRQVIGNNPDLIFPDQVLELPKAVTKRFHGLGVIGNLVY